MTYSDQKTGLESGRFGSAPLRKSGVEQGGASGANPLASSCSAPLHSKERSKWSSGAKPCGGGVEQNGVEQTPAIGTVISLDGQPYRLNRRVPYTRKDGTPSELLVWRAPCWSCGATFEVSTPVGGFSNTPSRRCHAHRNPGVKVQGLAIFTVIEDDMQDAANAEWTPVGKFGHTLTDAGEINYQFHVTGSVGRDRYAVQLFSWLTGEPTEIRIWPIEDLINCPLFDTEQAWVNAAERRADRC